jgi:nucleoside-diphosphate-sugar epimerase
MDLSETTAGVTGAGGFIGGRLVERLRERGASVRGLEVDEEAARRAEEAGAEVIVGDTRDEAAVAELCRGCDVVFHTAAVVGEGGDIDHYRSVNVRGTRQVAATAAETGVRRLVHLSSIMVYGFDPPPNVDETDALRGDDNPYCQTKLESDRVARAFHGRNDLEVVVARPGDVYGPRSHPWVVRPLILLKRGLFILPDRGRGCIETTYVDNLVDALFGLVEAEATGEAFNVTDGQTVTAKEFFSHHAAMLGQTRLRTAPASILKPLFAATESSFRWFGAEPPASADVVDFLSKPNGYSIAKLRSKLDYQPAIGLEEGMERTASWAREVGLVPEKTRPVSR